MIGRKKNSIFILSLIVSINAFSQNDSISPQNLKGQIIHANSKRVLSAAHILNLNTVEGTITNDNGYFQLKNVLCLDYLILFQAIQ